jgi:prepilin-type N-terminal cleavage/methylation domain-containing protein
MRRSAFTLMELLLVIAIIATLSALLIPVIGMVRKSAKTAKAETQLANIKAALSQYKDANGVFPERISAPFTDYSVIFNGGMSRARDVGETNWELANLNLLTQLQSVDRENFRRPTGGDPYLRDPFAAGARSKVIRYRPAKFYPLLAAAPSVAAIDSDNPPNPDSYQLWSAGYDGRDHFLDPTKEKQSDDIVNWVKK